MELSILSTVESVRELEAEWNQLVIDAEMTSDFYSSFTWFMFLFGAKEFIRCKPYFMVTRQDGVLSAVIPMYETEVRGR